MVAQSTSSSAALGQMVSSLRVIRRDVKDEAFWTALVEDWPQGYSYTRCYICQLNVFPWQHPSAGFRRWVNIWGRPS